MGRKLIFQMLSLHTPGFLFLAAVLLHVCLSVVESPAVFLLESEITRQRQ
jgi:hypothetical protein